jgi:hypothetical protein
VAEPVGWRLTDRRPTFQFAGDELGWYTLKRRRRHFTEINDPLADLSERDPYQPAATFPRSTRQCDHRAKRHQVTRAAALLRLLKLKEMEVDKRGAENAEPEMSFGAAISKGQSKYSTP